MPNHEPSHAFVDELMAWCQGWVTEDGRISAVHGHTDHDKVSGWLRADGAPCAGEVIVWESGECEVHVVDVGTREPRWVQHYDLATPEELVQLLQRFRAMIDAAAG
jgi:hypothetical protein